MDFEIENVEYPTETSCSFSVKGRLDTNASPKLGEFTDDLYKKGIIDLTVDMSSCNYIASSGLRVVVTMQKQAATTGGKLVFKDVTEDVMEIFTMTGFTNILTFE